MLEVRGGSVASGKWLTCSAFTPVTLEREEATIHCEHKICFLS